MLDYCLDVFEKKYKELGESLILDKYELDYGLYLLVNKDSGEIEDHIIVTKENKLDRKLQEKFIKLDYLSGWMSANKAVSTKAKSIQSNNYLSFWIKAEGIIPSPKTKEISFKMDDIDIYYNALANIEASISKDSKTKELYEVIKKDVGEIDKESLEKCRSWVKLNLMGLNEKYNLTKKCKFIKIFFSDSVEKYEKESKRYVYPRVFNSNKYNVSIDGTICGIHDFNMGLNSKKPNLLMSGRNTDKPMYVSIDKANLIKKFFDYLKCLVRGSKRENNLYISDELIPVKDDELLRSNFSGMYLRLRIEKNEAEIVDCTIVSRYSPKISIDVQEIIKVHENVDRKNPLIYGEITNLTDVRRTIDTVFYGGQLSRNLYSKLEDIKSSKMKPFLKNEIILTKQAYADWFYKCDKNEIKSIFEDRTLNIIAEYIYQGYISRAKEQFNLRVAIIKYLKGENFMGENTYESIYNELRANIKDGKTGFKDDKTYYFIMGQVAYYLLDKSNSNKKDMSELRTLDCRTSENLKQRIVGLFDKYSFAINRKDREFKNLMASILGYVPISNKVDKEAFYAGYLYSNLIIDIKVENSKNKENNKQNTGGNKDE